MSYRLSSYCSILRHIFHPVDYTFLGRADYIGNHKNKQGGGVQAMPDEDEVCVCVGKRGGPEEPPAMCRKLIMLKSVIQPDTFRPLFIKAD